MYQYSGDINVEYGGQWIDLDNWEWGYANCVRVIDLDSGCGAPGMVAIEHVTILLDKDRWAESLDCCGLTPWDVLGMDPDHRRYVLAECLLQYGHYDLDDAWDAYQSHWIEIIQTESDGPMVWEGLRAEKRVHCENLIGYIEAKHICYLN